MSEITCHIDFNVHDELKPVKAFIDRLQGIAEVDSGDCHIDLTKCQYLGPDAVVILAAVVLHKRSRNQHLRVTLPDNPAKLRAFCRFSGLQSLVANDEIPTEVGETVIPLRQIRTARWTDADPIIRLVHRHLEISEELEEYLRICVNEVVQNIEDHAESPIGGITCALPSLTAASGSIQRSSGVMTILPRATHFDASSKDGLLRCRGLTMRVLACAT